MLNFSIAKSVFTCYICIISSYFLWPVHKSSLLDILIFVMRSLHFTNICMLINPNPTMQMPTCCSVLKFSWAGLKKDRDSCWANLNGGLVVAFFPSWSNLQWSNVRPCLSKNLYMEKERIRFQVATELSCQSYLSGSIYLKLLFVLCNLQSIRNNALLW
jgi:hypothetical protein